MAALLALGCIAQAPTTGPKAAPKPKATSALASPDTGLKPGSPAPLSTDAVLRPLPQLGEPVTLAGRVRILSDVGGG